MVIVIFTPWFPPGFTAGGPVQSLSNLVNQKWDCIKYYVITGHRDLQDDLLNVEATDQWLPFNERTKVMYLSSGIRIIGVLRQLRKLKPDLFFITGIYSPVFTVFPLLFSGSRDFIISPRGMLHPPALRKKWFKKKGFLYFLRFLLRFRNVSFHATDAVEQEHILSALGSKMKVNIAQNIPVIHDPFLFPKERGSLQLITIALIGPMKNHIVVLEALKKIKTDVHYHIYGPVLAPSYWERCEAIIASLPLNVHVFYHGAVKPSLIPELLAKSHVFICPSESENFGHALFEAMSAGKPLITSHNTPWNELQVNQAGINVDPEVDQLAGAIRFFIDMGNEEYRMWSAGAATFCRSLIDLADIKKQYLKMFLRNDVL